MGDQIERSGNVKVVRGDSSVVVAVDVNNNGTIRDESDVTMIWTNEGKQVGMRGPCTINTFNGQSPQNVSNEELGTMAVNIANAVCPPVRQR